MPDVLCRGWGVLTKTPLFLDLEPHQPLVLIREPTNPYDRNAIIMADLFGQSMSYMARPAAARIAPRIDAGEMWLGRVKFVIGLHMRDFMAVIWRHYGDDAEAIPVEEARPRRRIRVEDFV